MDDLVRNKLTPPDDGDEVFLINFQFYLLPSPYVYVWVCIGCDLILAKQKVFIIILLFKRRVSPDCLIPSVTNRQTIHSSQHVRISTGNFDSRWELKAFKLLSFVAAHVSTRVGNVPVNAPCLLISMCLLRPQPKTDSN